MAYDDYQPNDLVQVTVSGRPKTVVAVVASKTSQGRWNDHEELFDVQGDVDLLRGVMRAWNGQRQFQLTVSEVRARSGGWF